MTDSAGNGPEQRAPVCTRAIDRNISAVAGLLLLAFVLVTVGCGTSELGTFIEPMGVALVVLSIASALLIAFGLFGCLQAVTVLLLGSAETEADRIRAIRFCDLGAISAVLSGGIASLIGTINMLSCGIYDPNALSLGTAIALLTVFYGLAIALIFVAGRFRVAEGRIRSPQTEARKADA